MYEEGEYLPKELSTAIEHYFCELQSPDKEDVSRAAYKINQYIKLFPTQDTLISPVSETDLEKDIDNFFVGMRCAQRQHVPNDLIENETQKLVKLPVAADCYYELFQFGMGIDSVFRTLQKYKKDRDFMIRLVLTPEFEKACQEESKDGAKGFYPVKLSDGVTYGCIGKLYAAAGKEFEQLLKKGREEIPLVIKQLEGTLLGSKQTHELWQKKGSGPYGAEIKELSEEVGKVNSIRPKVTSLLNALEALAKVNLLERESEFKNAYPDLKTFGEEDENDE